MFTNVPVSNQSYIKGSTIKKWQYLCMAQLIFWIPARGYLNIVHLISVTGYSQLILTWQYRNKLGSDITERNFEQHVYAKKNLLKMKL